VSLVERCPPGRLRGLSTSNTELLGVRHSGVTKIPRGVAAIAPLVWIQSDVESPGSLKRPPITRPSPKLKCYTSAWHDSVPLLHADGSIL
jgi:hypothetical protein